MDEIVNYVMETPGNTNPNILRSLLGKSGNNNILIVNMNINAGTITVDKTWSEIHDADFAIISGEEHTYGSMEVYSKNCMLIDQIGYRFSTKTTPSQIEYFIIASGSSGELELTTDSPDGYPS